MIKSFIVLMVVLIAAYFLNPTPDAHRQKIKSAIAEHNQLAGALGLGSLAAFVASYHSLGVASYTTVNGHTASIGVLGIVYVPD
jgi:hypothetical protein